MIDHSYIRSRLDYNPLTGTFTWKPWGTPTWRGRFAGTKAGHRSSSDGYVRIGFHDDQGKRWSFLGHRLAWFYVHGCFPPDQVDHIDGDRSNNALGNLRLATQAQNCANTRTRRDNSFGRKGVTKNGTGFQARITVGGERYSLGTYRTPEEAHEVYAREAARRFGEFAKAA